MVYTLPQKQGNNQGAFNAPSTEVTEEPDPRNEGLVGLIPFQCSYPSKMCVHITPVCVLV